MHFFYLDETGCTGINLADPEQPIFVLGGLSVKDEGWRATTSRFNEALDDFFWWCEAGGGRASRLRSHHWSGNFAGFPQDGRNALAHRYLDIIAERLHSIHFVAIDKPAMAAKVAGAPEAFFDLTVPYLLGFNDLVSYIERYTREALGQSARAIIILDPKEQYQAQLDTLTHFRRYEVVKARQLKWLVEFSYPVDWCDTPWSRYLTSSFSLFESSWKWITAIARSGRRPRAPFSLAATTK